MKKLWLFTVVAALAVGAAACGGGGGGGDITGDLTAVTVNSKTATGDINPAVNVGVATNGALKFTVGGVDADGDGTVEKTTLGSVTVSSPAAIALKALTDAAVSCDSGTAIGEGDVATQFDIGISLDTTASMNAAAQILAGKIAEFATLLGNSGVDVLFTGITVGDAFATKKSSGTEFTDGVSAGTLGIPPSFDTCERPDTGTSLTSSANLSTFFTAVQNAPSFEFGCSGMGGTENYLGAIQWLVDNIGWRAGAARNIISIGDNCAYTNDTPGDSIIAPWLPPAPADLIADLSNTTVHVIGSEFLSCSSNQYDPQGLATATGGQFIPIGSCTSVDTCNVDLSSLPITTSITNSFIFNCDGRASFYEGEGCYPFTLNVSSVGSTSGTTYNGVVTIVICLDFL